MFNSSFLVCIAFIHVQRERPRRRRKKDESYFLFFFFKKRWFVILAFHVPYNVYFCSPLDFSLEHVFIPFDVEYRHSFPFRFAEDMNVMDVPLLPQCIIMFNVPVCQRRITLQKVVITSSPTPSRNVNN